MPFEKDDKQDKITLCLYMTSADLKLIEKFFKGEHNHDPHCHQKESAAFAPCRLGSWSQGRELPECLQEQMKEDKNIEEKSKRNGLSEQEKSTSKKNAPPLWPL